VVFRYIGKAFLILIPLTVSIARLHSSGVGTPTEVTRDVTRCLSVVRAAATRRGQSGPTKAERTNVAPWTDAPRTPRAETDRARLIA
jgi:hypothetical protein